MQLKQQQNVFDMKGILLEISKFAIFEEISFNCCGFCLQIHIL